MPLIYHKCIICVFNRYCKLIKQSCTQMEKCWCYLTIWPAHERDLIHLPVVPPSCGKYSAIMSNRHITLTSILHLYFIAQLHIMLCVRTMKLASSNKQLKHLTTHTLQACANTNWAAVPSSYSTSSYGQLRQSPLYKTHRQQTLLTAVAPSWENHLFIKMYCLDNFTRRSSNSQVMHSGVLEAHDWEAGGDTT